MWTRLKKVWLSWRAGVATASAAPYVAAGQPAITEDDLLRAFGCDV
ncbi:hypothetical protein [Deinococcus sp. Marseille-Q6407]|nr:hypothetical protein [Deinococcus sp. Marseille-Q6407]